MNSILISIEGNIGAGKTTLLHKLREAEPSWVIVEEPVEKWLLYKDDATEKSLLELYYTDKRRWAYTFQTIVLLTRVQQIVKLLKEQPKPVIMILERSMESDRALFASMMREEGDMNSIEWKLYEEWYTQLLCLVSPVTHFLWLDVDVETCARQIQTRGRLGEESIDLAYLQKLDTSHREWLGAMPESHCIRLETNAVDSVRTALYSRWLSNWTKVSG